MTVLGPLLNALALIATKLLIRWLDRETIRVDERRRMELAALARAIQAYQTRSAPGAPDPPGVQSPDGALTIPPSADPVRSRPGDPVRADAHLR